MKETAIVFLPIAMKGSSFAKKGKGMERVVMQIESARLSCVLARYVSLECSKSGQFATEIRTVKQMLVSTIHALRN